MRRLVTATITATQAIAAEYYGWWSPYGEIFATATYYGYTRPVTPSTDRINKIDIWKGTNGCISGVKLTGSTGSYTQGLPIPGSPTP